MEMAPHIRMLAIIASSVMAAYFSADGINGRIDGLNTKISQFEEQRARRNEELAAMHGVDAQIIRRLDELEKRHR